jgi:hypothetical protein
MSIDTDPNGHDCNELVYGEYLLADDAVWLIVKDFSIHIHGTDEGIVVDVYALGNEDEDAIATTYAPDNECEGDAA